MYGVMGTLTSAEITGKEKRNNFSYSTGNQTWPLFFIVPKYPFNGDRNKNG